MFKIFNFQPSGLSLQVCYCNLIKRDRDRTNHLWVAEGTEISTYDLSYDHPHCSHLKGSVSFLKNWVKTSGSVCFFRFLYAILDFVPQF